MSTYPLFLAHIERKHAVVVGDRPLAVHKTRELLEAGFGRVTLIGAAAIGPELAAEPRLRRLERPYAGGDLRGAQLVVASDLDRALNARLARDAAGAGALLLAMDDIPRCDVFGGAQLRRGELAISIGSGGAAPALAARLRDRIEALLDEELPELERFVALARQLRPTIAATLPRYADRKAFWYHLVDDPTLAQLLRDDLIGAARRRVSQLLALASGARGWDAPAPAPAPTLPPRSVAS